MLHNGRVLSCFEPDLGADAGHTWQMTYLDSISWHMLGADYGCSCYSCTWLPEDWRGHLSSWERVDIDSAWLHVLLFWRCAD
jgi:hypothetical protein